MGFARAPHALRARLGARGAPNPNPNPNPNRHPDPNPDPGPNPNPNPSPDPNQARAAPAASGCVAAISSRTASVSGSSLVS